MCIYMYTYTQIVFITPCPEESIAWATPLAPGAKWRTSFGGSSPLRFGDVKKPGGKGAEKV